MIIDKWVDKWSYIFRSLKKKTNNISADLSGGFDTRTVLSLLLNSGIDLNDILINSDKKKVHDHDIDYIIAENISSKYGFTLNNFMLDNNGTDLSLKDSLFISIYSKLAFHKEFYFKKKFFTNPRFGFSGGGGEFIRGYPGSSYEIYIKKLSLGGRKIRGYNKMFYDSSIKLCNRSINKLKNTMTFNNDYEIASFFYAKSIIVTHFGSRAVESFLTNTYILQPLIDSDLWKINFNIRKESSHDLVSYLYVRFSHDLIYFPFQGNRTLNPCSIKKAENLNNKNTHYKIKLDYNDNFYIDKKRKSHLTKSEDVKNVDDSIKEIAKSSKFISIINNLYSNSVYEWAIGNSKKSNFYPLRHIYSLLSIAKIMDDLYISKGNSTFFNL